MSNSYSENAEIESLRAENNELRSELKHAMKEFDEYKQKYKTLEYNCDSLRHNYEYARGFMDAVKMLCSDN